MSGQERVNPNSARYWWPPLESAQDQLIANLPETKLVEYDRWDAVRAIDGDPEALPWDDFHYAASGIGYPIFVRTGLASAKHHGENSFVAETPDDLRGVITRTLDYTIAKDLLASALMLREWINLETRFKAFGGTPIAREYRVFASADGVECSHYYWPADSIQSADKDDWRDRLDYLNQRDAGDIALMEHDARIAAAACGDGAWSVDFAMDWVGDWWLIDMARAEDSWHPENCPQSFTKVAVDGKNGGDS